MSWITWRTRKLLPPLGGPIGEDFAQAFGAEQDTEAALLRIALLSRLPQRCPDDALDAFDYLIPLASPTVTRWKVRDDNPNGPGTTKVVLANASGPTTGPEVAAVLALLGSRSVRPLGSGALQVIAATALPLTITGTLLLDGSNAAAITQANAALVALGNSYDLGPAILYLDRVIATLMGIPSVVNIVTLDLAADLTIPEPDVLVITPAITEA